MLSRHQTCFTKLSSSTRCGWKPDAMAAPATAMDFLSLPEGKAVELCNDEHEHSAWEALDAMATADLHLAPEMCHLNDSLAGWCDYMFFFFSQRFSLLVLCLEGRC